MRAIQHSAMLYSCNRVLIKEHRLVSTLQHGPTHLSVTSCHGNMRGSMCGGLLSSVPSLTSCSSLQLLHARPPRLLRAHCTCPRHKERLREGGKEKVHEQPCSQLCDQVPHVRTCVGAPSEQCGVTHKLQLPPTTPCTSAKAAPCLMRM